MHHLTATSETTTKKYKLAGASQEIRLSLASNWKSSPDFFAEYLVSTIEFKCCVKKRIYVWHKCVLNGSSFNFKLATLLQSHIND